MSQQNIRRQQTNQSRQLSDRYSQRPSYHHSPQMPNSRFLGGTPSPRNQHWQSRGNLPPNRRTPHVPNRYQRQLQPSSSHHPNLQHQPKPSSKESPLAAKDCPKNPQKILFTSPSSNSQQVYKENDHEYNSAYPTSGQTDYGTQDFDLQEGLNQYSHDRNYHNYESHLTYQNENYYGESYSHGGYPRDDTYHLTDLDATQRNTNHKQHYSAHEEDFDTNDQEVPDLIENEHDETLSANLEPTESDQFNAIQDDNQLERDHPVWVVERFEKKNTWRLETARFPYTTAAGSTLEWAQKSADTANYKTFSRETCALMKSYKDVICKHIPHQLGPQERHSFCAVVGNHFPKIAKGYGQFVEMRKEGKPIDGVSKTTLKEVLAEYLLVKFNQHYNYAGRQEEAEYEKTLKDESEEEKKKKLKEKHIEKVRKIGTSEALISRNKKRKTNHTEGNGPSTNNDNNSNV